LRRRSRWKPRPIERANAAEEERHMDMGRVIREVEAPAPIDIPLEEELSTEREDAPALVPTAAEEPALAGAE
jgi:hypothetical protein